MPDADTDPRAGLDLEELERDHGLRESYYRGKRVRECGTCRGEWPCTAARLLAEVRRLREELADARQEIARHHKDFAVWQGYAEQGLASLEERRRPRTATAGLPAIRQAAQRVKAARTASEQFEAAQDLARLVNALDPPAPPHVAGEAAEGANPGSNQCE